MSDPASLRSAAEAIIAALEEARTACILPGFLAVRVGLRGELQSFGQRFRPALCYHVDG